MGGWMGVKAVVRIAYINQKLHCQCQIMVFKCSFLAFKMQKLLHFQLQKMVLYMPINFLCQIFMKLTTGLDLGKHQAAIFLSEYCFIKVRFLLILIANGRM